MPDSAVVNGAMAETKTEKFINKIDPDDPEYQKQLIRPAEIKEDVNLMSQRRRVSLILKSEAFRRELEDVVRSQMRSGEYPGLSTSLLSLQHISELFSSAPVGPPSTGGGFSKGSRGGGVIPINDLRRGDIAIYSRHERSLRCKVASVYRLIDLFSWSSSIYNLVTARVTRNNEHFLVNPFGLLNHEITASSLIKVDSKGQVIDPGSTVLGINLSTWMLHSAVHAARADIRCIIHLDRPSTIAVSCMKSGLLPLCHEAMILGDVAYYNPTNPLTPATNGDTTKPGDGDSGGMYDWNAARIAVSEALGPTARVLFVRSHGLLALGETVEEAWHYAMNAVVACDTQLPLMSLGQDNLVLPTDKVRKQTYVNWRSANLGGLSGREAALALRLATSGKSSAGEGGYSSGANGTDTGSPGSPGRASRRPWRIGELEFEAMMRHLDNAGCRTGHIYRQEAMASPHRSRRRATIDGVISSGQFEDVEIPPSTSSTAAMMAYLYDEGCMSGDETETAKPSTLRRDWSDKAWLNTPNNYAKELVEPAPGYVPVVRWISCRERAIRSAIASGALPPPAPFRPLTPAAVPLGSTGGQPTGTLVSTHNRFAPQGSDPKEYKEHQKMVKAKYYQDTNTAGPQSRLLDGLTWDEVRRIRDDGLMKTFGPGAAALVSRGAVPEKPLASASRAIINPDFRGAAVIYDGLYAHQNPFDKITDEELEMYRQEIELKNNPELAAALQRQLEEAAMHLDAPSPTGVTESAAVDSGATDLESGTEAGHARLVPPAGASGTLTSEPSGPEDYAGSPDKKLKKKKRRFKLPSFSLRSKEKEKGDKEK